MSEKLSLKEMEKKVFRSYYEDGLWEIYLGLLLLNMGLPFVLLRVFEDAPLWQIAMPLLLVALVSYTLFWAGKKYVVLPRVGHVKLGSKGRQRRRSTAFVFAGSVVVGLAVFVVASMFARGNLSGDLPPDVIIAIVWTINVVVVFGLAAYFLAYDRFYVIGVLFALPFPMLIGVDRLFGIDLGFVAWAVPAGIILFLGLGTFIHFLRNNPLPESTAMQMNENHT